MLDLLHTVREQGGRARDSALREAELEARDLRAHLRRRDGLARIPAEFHFRLEQGALVVPPELGWLDPPPVFDHQALLGILARERLARATRTQDSAGFLAWTELLDDPGPRGVARAWVLARVAWAAHRAGEPERRDALLEELAGQVGAAPPSVRASALILRVVRGDLPTGDELLATLVALPRNRAVALAGRLTQRGIAVSDALQGSQRARTRRALLRLVRPLVPLLAASDTPVVRVVGDHVCLFFPSLDEGALADLDGLRNLAAPLLGSRTAALVPDVPGEFDSAPVVPGFAVLRAAPVPTVGFAAGPTGLAVLVAALATLCGGGTFLALRGARRETEATRLRGEFLTTVTHELKTPLAGIRLVSELLADDHVRDAPRRREYFGRLIAESTRLSMLIENMLDLRRLEQGERAHDPRPEELGALVNETVKLIVPLAERDGLEIEVRTADVPLTASIDRDALRQALLNVLDNARKYAAQGRRILVSLTGDGECARIRIQDNGPGVAPEEREAIFARFRRGSSQRHGSIPGVGIGLDLARSLARLQGGELRCIDPPAGSSGACFEFQIPLLEPSEARL